MTRISLLFLSLALPLLALSAEPSKGYRGFVEICDDFNSRLTADDTRLAEGELIVSGLHRRMFTDVTLATSHGYQFNPHLFAGIGILGGYSSLCDAAFVGAYLHLRTDWKISRYTPFAEVRGGFYWRYDGMIYLSPAVGYRFDLGRRLNLNVALGITLLHEHEPSEYTYFYDHDGNRRLILVGASRFFRPACTVRFGIDF